MKGSIQQRSKGTWRIRVDRGYVVDQETGERRRKQYTETVKGTKKQAEEHMREILRTLDRGEFVEPSKKTFREWLDEWQKAVVARKAVRTQETYKSDIELHIKLALGDYPLQKIQATDLQTYYNGLALSQSTVARHHIIIHSALDAALKLGYVTRNVAKLVPHKPKQGNEQQDAIEHCWTAQEATQFLKAAAEEGTQACVFYTLALETGMRKGELCGLKWQDVDLTTRTITVSRTLLKPGHEPVFGPPKNKQARTLKIAPATAKLLKKHKVEQAECKMRNRQAYRDHGLVFAKEWQDMQRQTDCLGDPLQINNIGQRQYAKIIKAARVKEIKFHGMRHTFATLALSRGWQPHEVQKVLGHKRVEITMNIYAHVLPNRQEEMAESMSALYNG